MSARQIILTTLVCMMTVGALGQNLNEKIGIVTLNIGLGSLNNNSLNNWLRNNGVNSSDTYCNIYGLELLVPTTWRTDRREYLAGLAGSYSFAKNPSLLNIDLSFLFGKSYQASQNLLLCPIIGLGGYSVGIKTKNQVPTSLISYNVKNGTLIRNYLLLSPRILILKRFASKKWISNYKFSIGIEIGCKIILDVGGSWYYSGDNKRIHIAGIPNVSVFQPFVTVPIGFVGSKTR